MVTRVLDLAILLLLAAAIVIPRPDVKVKPALPPDPAVRARVAELQTQLVAAPGDVPAALELADIFMDLRHPDWALASLEGALDAHPDDYRVHHLASLALVDHFEPGHAFAEAQKALTLCESGSSVACGDSERSRLGILKSTLDRIKNMDMRRDPNSAKEQLIQGLRLTYIRKNAVQKPGTKTPPPPRADNKSGTHP